MQMHCSFQYLICLILFSGIAFSFSYNLSESEEFCPTFCSCDFYDGLNRANCSSQRLTGPNVELSSAVEILDLSHNDVTILDNNCFQSLVYLHHLNLSHNSVHTIYLDAFSSLRSVTHIDLSHNRLEYLDERIFEANRKLKSLSLAANKFMSLQNKPLVRSFSLRSLNLRRSQITYLYEELFLALPNLRELDLSQNLMITLNVAAFGALQNLEHINLSENRWHCDRGLLNPIEVLLQRSIRLELAECPVREETPVTPVMFERMELLEPSDTSEVNFAKPKEPESIRTKIANVWRRPAMTDYEREDDEEAESDAFFHSSEELKRTSLLHPSGTEQCDESWYRLCHKYRSCLHNISSTRNKEVVGSTAGFTVSDLCFVFLLGIALGVIFVVCIISCTLCIKCCCEMRRKHDYQMVENILTPHTTTQHTMLPHQMIPHSETLTAVPQSTELQTQQRTRTSQRRAARRPTANNSRNALARHDYAMSQGRDNFLSRLFGRPARHQYYRTINHNTATLIRRLSRSNLFSNRLSHHFAEETNSWSQQQQQQQHQRTPTASSFAQTSRQEYEEVYGETLLSTDTVEISSEQRVNPSNRPETPPPSYREVVVNAAK